MDQDPAEDGAAEPAHRDAAAAEVRLVPAIDVGVRELAGLFGERVGLLGGGERGDRVGLGERERLFEVPLGFVEPGARLGADRAASGRDEVRDGGDLGARGRDRLLEPGAGAFDPGSRRRGCCRARWRAAR